MEKNKKQIDLEVDTLYMCALAMDLILRDSQRRMLAESQTWKHDKRMMFKQYLQHVKNACIVHDKIYQDVIDAEERNKFKCFQAWQEKANEYARLLLLYEDKSGNIESVDSLFSEINNLPGEDTVDEEMLNMFHLTKSK